MKLLGLRKLELSKRFVCHYHFDEKYLLTWRLARTAVPNPCVTLTENAKVSSFPPKSETFSLRYLFSQGILEDINLPPRLECAECCQRFRASNEIARHIAFSHKVMRCFACRFCNKFFLSKETLKQHLEVHDPKHACSVCSRKFLSSRVLLQHMHEHGKFICEVTKKAFDFVNKWKEIDQFPDLFTLR